MRRMGVMLALAAALPLGGCVSAVKTVVTAPFKLGEAAYDGLTESQEEADIKRGRAARKQEERDAKERKRQEKAWRKAQREREGR